MDAHRASPGFRDAVVEGNGLRHHLVVWGDRGRPPVVMIPGLTMQAHTLDPVAERLAERHEVFCLDVRGRGQSDWGPPDAYHLDSYVADLEAVRAGLGLERFALVGSHMGGVIAVYYASRFPSRVDRVVLNDIAPTVAPAGARRMWARAAAVPTSFADLGAVARYYRQAYAESVGALPAARMDEFARWQVRWSDDEGAFVWWMDPAARDAMPRPTGFPKPWEVYRAVAAPVLLVRGEHSELVDVETTERMVREGVDCHVADVPGISWAPSLTEPESVAAVDAFLAADPGSSIRSTG